MKFDIGPNLNAFISYTVHNIHHQCGMIFQAIALWFPDECLFKQGC